MCSSKVVSAIEAIKAKTAQDKTNEDVVELGKRRCLKKCLEMPVCNRNVQRRETEQQFGCAHDIRGCTAGGFRSTQVSLSKGSSRSQTQVETRITNRPGATKGGHDAGTLGAGAMVTEWARRQNHKPQDPLPMAGVATGWLRAGNLGTLTVCGGASSSVRSAGEGSDRAVQSQTQSVVWPIVWQQLTSRLFR